MSQRSFYKDLTVAERILVKRWAYRLLIAYGFIALTTIGAAGLRHHAHQNSNDLTSAAAMETNTATEETGNWLTR